MYDLLKDKIILDATAGHRMMWFDKHHPNVLYLDQRPECEPDIVGDYCNLHQFKDNTFKIIIFDPPHITQKNPYGDSEIIKEYGYLNPETWHSDLKKAFHELFRVLKPEGILLFKWATAKISSNEVIKLSPIKPLFYSVSAIRGTKHRGQKINKTLWFCFMKPSEMCVEAKER